MACALWLVAGVQPASAQGRLEAQYEATLAGIPGRQGHLEHRDQRRSAIPPPPGGTTGLLKTISNGSGTGEAQGRIVNGAMVPGL